MAIGMNIDSDTGSPGYPDPSLYYLTLLSSRSCCSLGSVFPAKINLISSKDNVSYFSSALASICNLSLLSVSSVSARLYASYIILVVHRGRLSIDPYITHNFDLRLYERASTTATIAETTVLVY